MNLEKRIYDVMIKYALDRASIIINSEYLKYAGKVVFVQLKKNGISQKERKQEVDVEEEEKEKPFTTTYLDVFINTTVKASPGSITRHKAGTVRKAVPEVLQQLEKIIEAPSISGSSVINELNRVDSSERWSVTADEEFNFIIIKSVLYRAIEEMKGQDMIFSFGGTELTLDQVRKIRQSFEQKSYKLYGNLVYRDVFKKFKKKISFGSKDMYQIQNAFIPVLIEYDKVYNPIINDNILMNSKLLTMAREKGRVRESEYFRAYLLTHMEICAALNMKNFVRFTPAFLYNFIVGLAHPPYTGFPSDTGEIFVDIQNPVGSKSYSRGEFAARKQSLEQHSKDSSLRPEERGLAAEQLEYMKNGNNYVLMTSLEQYCYIEREKLAAFGSTALDDSKPTGAQYYKYLREARLW